ncbi:CocE/NonD family hydrolase [Bacterioplanoides sp.]|uniref:CocE/NonD family hydrolase n=1 Tax=Bacterioplanoides sp. TaxID=2066072 RepID=UPI003B5BD11D
MDKKYLILLPLVAAISACGGDNNSSSSAPTPTPKADNRITSEQFPGVSCEKVSVSTTSGNNLTAYIYTPTELSEDTKLPAIAQRDPYGRLLNLKCFGGAIPIDSATFVRAGYVYVIQENRGTNASEGLFKPFVDEAKDGAELIDWISKQEWSDGNVGMRGPSYSGINTWQAATEAPAALKAISTSVTPEDAHRDAAYNDGVFALNTTLSWFETSFVADNIIRKETAAGSSAEDIQAKVGARAAILSRLYSEHAQKLPVSSIDIFDGLDIDNFWNETIANPDYDPYWRRVDVGEKIDNIKVPALIHGAWYDVFANGTVELYKNMKSHAGSKEAQEGTKLLMSQYGHSMNQSTPSFGLPAYGYFRDFATVAAAAAAKDESALASFKPYDLDFFNFHLKGMENGFNSTPNVQLTVLVPPNAGETGSTFQVTGTEYPLPDTEYKSFYLQSSGDANDRAGSGALSESPSMANGNIPFVGSVAAGSAAADVFMYDPANPVPTTGGNLCCGNDQIRQLDSMAPQSGAVDQTAVEERADVLVYTTPALDDDMAVIGPVSVRLFAKTDGMDTDFTAKLVAVRPDGKTHNLIDGIVRAKLRSGSKNAPELVEPNRTYEYEIQLGNIATMFPKGHKIRLQVSSSNFPKYARNLNTGKSNLTTSETRVAKQVILHDAAHQSRLILPVVDSVSIPATN